MDALVVEVDEERDRVSIPRRGTGISSTTAELLYIAPHILKVIQHVLVSVKTL
jgi:hypothetical protein